MMQFLVYWALLTFGPLSLGVGISFMVGSFQGSALASFVPQWMGSAANLRHAVFRNAFAVVSVPIRTQPFCARAPCFHRALITAFCLETARFLFAWYMGNFDGYRSIYGAFAAVPFFLAWLNLLWTLLLGGAVLTSSLSYWRERRFVGIWIRAGGLMMC